MLLVHCLAFARILALDLLNGRQNALPHALPVQAALFEHTPIPDIEINPTHRQWRVLKSPPSFNGGENARPSFTVPLASAHG